MNQELKDRLKARCDASKAAESAIQLIQESETGNVEHYWKEIRDAVLKRAPLGPNEAKQLDAMSEQEANKFELGEIPFGQYQGDQVKDVPLDYIEWLISREESDTFKQDLRRYLLLRNKGTIEHDN